MLMLPLVWSRWRRRRHCCCCRRCCCCCFWPMAMQQFVQLLVLSGGSRDHLLAPSLLLPCFVGGGWRDYIIIISGVDDAFMVYMDAPSSPSLMLDDFMLLSLSCLLVPSFFVFWGEADGAGGGGCRGFVHGRRRTAPTPPTSHNSPSQPVLSPK